MTVCNGFNNENQRMRLISRWFRILPRLKPGFQTKRGIQRTPYISYFHDLWLPDSGPWPYHPNPYYTNALPDTPNLYKRTSATLKEISSPLPFGGWWLRTRQIHYSPQSEGVTLHYMKSRGVDPELAESVYALVVQTVKKEEIAKTLLQGNLFSYHLNNRTVTFQSTPMVKYCRENWSSHFGKK